VCWARWSKVAWHDRPSGHIGLGRIGPGLTVPVLVPVPGRAAHLATYMYNLSLLAASGMATE
jgi:hypothetical protein